VTNPLPDFMLIGAQKSGTSWLAEWLSRSPDVFMPPDGELMFFDTKNNHTGSNLDQYRQYFSGAEDHQRVGERTANYLWVSESFPEWGPPDPFRQGTPERVHEALGEEMQFIAVLRNPINRAISGFLHHRRRGRIRSNARLRNEWGKRGVAHMGLYASHLNRWRDAYPKERILVVTYERLFKDDVELKRIADFLAIREPGKPVSSSDVLHKGTGFERTEAGVFDPNGFKIANRSDIERVRELYADEVSYLKEQWSLDISPWADDFAPDMTDVG